MYNILTLNKISKAGLAGFDAERYVCADAFDAPDAVIVRSASMHEMDIPASVKAIARAGAGTNNIPIDVCTDKGIVVFNTPGANANAVKELVICGLLLASRKVAASIDWCKTLKGNGAEVGKMVEKGKSNFTGPEISGKVLGVVGLGAIGVLVANAAAALGMKVIGYDPFLSDKSANALVKEITVTAELDKIFAESDYITLHAPSTAETKGMINTVTLAECKDAVRILNFARGDLVDSADLIAAIDSGKVAAYVTDFPTDDMLCHDGITAIPHLGASSPESEENCATMAVAQLQNFLDNGNIVNSVNFPAVELERTGVERLCVLSKEPVEDAVIALLKTVRVSKALTAKKKAAYSVIDVLDEIPDEAVEAVKAIDGVLRVFVIK